MTDNTLIFNLSINDFSNMKRVNSSAPINIDSKEYVCRAFRRITY